MKVFEYQDDSWWDSVCDCHEPILMPCYNLLNDVDCYTYSCHTEEDCYRQALELEGIIDDEYEFIKYYDGGILKQLCEDNDIEIIIHYDKEFDEQEF